MYERRDFERLISERKHLPFRSFDARYKRIRRRPSISRRNFIRVGGTLRARKHSDPRRNRLYRARVFGTPRTIYLRSFAVRRTRARFLSGPLLIFSYLSPARARARASFTLFQTSPLPNALLSVRSLDQIAAVLDLTARWLHSLRPFPSSFTPLSFSLGSPSHLSRSFLHLLAGRLKIGTGLKVPARQRAVRTRARTNR